MTRKNAITAALVVATAATISGCALFASPEPAPALQFTYTTDHGAEIGLVRAFTLQGNTVLQFIDLAQAQPTILAAGQVSPVPYKVTGQYAVLPGVYSSLKVRSAGKVASVMLQTPALDALEANGTASHSQPAADAAPPPAPRLEPVAETKTEADANERTLPEILTELEAKKRELADLRERMTQLQRTNILPAPMLIVPINEKPRNWTLTGGRTLRDNLRELARQAGYTEPVWKAKNPYMVGYTTTYTGTFTDIIGQISDAVPALDFILDAHKHTVEVVDAHT